MTDHRWILVALVAASAIAFAMLPGCSNAELSLGQAQRLIEEAEEFQEARGAIYIPFRHGLDHHLAELCGQGTLWRQTGGWLNLNLTEEAKTFLRGGGISFSGTLFLTLKEPPHVVEVTGMRGEEREKLVEFSMTWECPERLGECVEAVQALDPSRFGIPVREASALLAIYDDGWRVVELNLP